MIANLRRHRAQSRLQAIDSELAQKQSRKNLSVHAVPGPLTDRPLSTPIWSAAGPNDDVRFWEIESAA